MLALCQGADRICRLLSRAVLRTDDACRGELTEGGRGRGLEGVGRGAGAAFLERFLERLLQPAAVLLLLVGQKRLPWDIKQELQLLIVEVTQLLVASDRRGTTHQLVHHNKEFAPLQRAVGVVVKRVHELLQLRLTAAVDPDLCQKPQQHVHRDRRDLFPLTSRSMEHLPRSPPKDGFASSTHVGGNSRHDGVGSELLVLVKHLGEDSIFHLEPRDGRHLVV
mmetsp:Transcript_45517/g.93109  ORF Transcript_45517/g.93109 Transcript_45517/m.93109 type:complete len:222 (-) Transcript_45517:927-1592(-)